MGKGKLQVLEESVSFFFKIGILDQEQTLFIPDFNHLKPLLSMEEVRGLEYGEENSIKVQCRVANAKELTLERIIAIREKLSQVLAEIEIPE